MNKKNICNLSKKMIAVSLSMSMFMTSNGISNSNCDNRNLKRDIKVTESLNSKNMTNNSDKYILLETDNSKGKKGIVNNIKKILKNSNKCNWIIGGTFTGANLLLLIANLSMNKNRVALQSERDKNLYTGDSGNCAGSSCGDVQNNNLIKQKFKDFETALDLFLKLMDNPQMVWNSYNSRRNINSSEAYNFNINYNANKYIVTKSPDLWEQYKSRFANIIISWNNFISTFKMISDLNNVSVRELNDIQNLQYIPKNYVSFEDFAIYLFNSIEKDNCFNILNKFVDSDTLQKVIDIFRAKSDNNSCVDFLALVKRTVWTNHIGKSESKKWQTKIFRECKINFIQPQKSTEPNLSEKDKINKRVKELYQDLVYFVGQDTKLMKNFIEAFEKFKNSSNWKKSAWYDYINTEYTPSEENDSADACFTAFKELKNYINMDSFNINKNYKDNYYNFYRSAKNCYDEIRNILNIFDYFNLEKENVSLNNIEEIEYLFNYTFKYLLKFYKNKTKKIDNIEISFNNLVYKMNEIGIDIKKINCDFEFNIIRLQ